MCLTFSECVYFESVLESAKGQFPRLTSKVAITGNYVFLRTILLRGISLSWPYFFVPC